MNMNSYIPIPITEDIIAYFKPTRLCIKKLAGVYYFCKSTKKDIVKYSGSGEKWKNLIKKYGKENIETLWVSDWYFNADEIHEVALHFSKENRIVESELWANLAPEWGIDFYTRLGVKESDVTRQKKREARLGSKNPMFGLKGKLSPIFGREKTKSEIENLKISVKKYANNRPKSHNENISKGLKGNQKLIDRTTGEKNPCFKGYYISPNGERFDSSRKAAKTIGKDKKTLISWAKNNKNGWSYQDKNSESQNHSK